jgi:acyl carrier protein
MKHDLKPRVCRVLASIFGVPLDSVDTSTSQATVEPWDSLSHIHLIVALEAEFSVSFTPEQALEMTNVQAICDVLRAKGAAG